MELVLGIDVALIGMNINIRMDTAGLAASLTMRHGSTRRVMGWRRSRGTGRAVLGLPLRRYLCLGTGLALRPGVALQSRLDLRSGLGCGPSLALRPGLALGSRLVLRPSLLLRPRLGLRSGLTLLVSMLLVPMVIGGKSDWRTQYEGGNSC